MYQMFGTVRPRCMSLESRGLPLAVCLPAITQLLEPGAQPSQSGKPRRSRRARGSSWGSRTEGELRFIVSQVPKAGPGAPEALLAWLRSSSSSSLAGAGAGCGWLQSTISPVGGWSRHEPTGYRSDSSFGLRSRAATTSRESFAYQCVSSISTIIMPMLTESTPLHGCGR